MWYYTVGDEEIGPVSAAELKALAKDGTVGPNTQVWKEGTAEWTTAGKVKGLIPAKKKPQQQRRQQRPRQREVVEEYDEYGGGYDDYGDDYGDSNPYSAPRGRGRSSGQKSSRKKQYDVFTNIFIILDIVFSLFRAAACVFGIVGAIALSNLPPNAEVPDGLAAQAWIEAVVSGLLFLVGITAAVLLLMKIRAGVFFGWAAVGLTAVSCLLTVVQLVMGTGLEGQLQGPNAEAAMVGRMVGGACAIIVRLGLVACYAIAVKKAGDVLSR